MTTRARLAAALSAPLLLTACGATSDLQADAAAADAALREARSVGMVLRFEDGDGALVEALSRGEDGLPAELAEVLVAGRLAVQLSATGDRTLGDVPAADAPVEEQVRWYDGALSVGTPSGDVFATRLVGGELYVATDLDEVERLAAAEGEPADLDAALEDAPAPLAQAVQDLRAGRWLRLPYAEMAGELDQLAGPTPEGEPTPPPSLSPELLRELTDAVQPHVRLADLGSDDGVRRVAVDVDVKALLQAAADAVESSLATGPLPTDTLGTDELDGLTDESLSGTLTIEDGHYRSLEVPLEGLVALVDDPEADALDLGSSTLVLELDDDPAPVEVPEQVSDVDLWEAFSGMLGATDDGLAPTPEDEALLACYEEAETDEELLACEELG